MVDAEAREVDKAICGSSKAHDESAKALTVTLSEVQDGKAKASVDSTLEETGPWV